MRELFSKVKNSLVIVVGILVVSPSLSSCETGRQKNRSSSSPTPVTEVSPNQNSESAQDYVIEPGRRIGKVQIGADRQAVHSLLRQPQGTYAVRKGLKGDYWSSGKDDLRIFYENDKVVQISVTSSRFSTPEGLSTGNSLAEVQRKDEGLRKYHYFAHGSGGVLIDYYDDVGRGVAFEFTANASAEKRKYEPYAILVHRPGHPVIADADEGPEPRS